MKKLFFIAIALIPSSVYAVQITLNKDQAEAGSGEQISGMIRDIYQFALAAGGILAFGAIVYGAIKWTVSAGNPSQIGEAKQWITDALLGLLLLVGAFVILNTINPAIVSLTPPDDIIKNLSPSPPPPGP